MLAVRRECDVSRRMSKLGRWDRREAVVDDGEKSTAVGGAKVSELRSGDAVGLLSVYLPPYCQFPFWPRHLYGLHTWSIGVIV
jgi:hypothetical protein